ncbi:MAG: 3-deoxy-D-manno-octulosonic acid transferase [Acidobacteriaceae bacterium]
MIVFYNLLLLLALLLGAPYWAYRILSRPKLREGLRERFGLAPRRARTHNRRVVWVHAVSVGEVVAVSRFIHDLETRAPDIDVIVSTTTRTGQRLAQDRFGAARCFYFPFDLPWVVRRSLSQIKPALLVLTESELWPNMLHCCRRRGIPVLVVNGRISDRSLPRYLALRRFWKSFLQALSLVLAQSEEDARRFIRIGLPTARVHCGGNLKFDVRMPQPLPIVAAVSAQLPSEARVLVCGSTLAGEELMLLDAWTQVCARVPDAVMILAPRHPERFAEVAALLDQRRAAWHRRSTWLGAPQPLLPASILLLDTIGELAALYAVAQLAFVGGSLIDAGGHNPLEPAQFGVPSVVGEHNGNFRGIVDRLLAREAIRIVAAGSLSHVLTDLLADKEAAEKMGARALEVFDSEAGATELAIDAALMLLSDSRPRV